MFENNWHYLNKGNYGVMPPASIEISRPDLKATALCGVATVGWGTT